MDTIAAFVAKSFAGVDQPKVQIVESLLSAFKPQGFIWRTAEPAEVEQVSQKVRTQIEECQVFVGVLTRRHPIYGPPVGLRGRYDAFLGKYPILGWTCAPWLLQESGYALALRKRLVLFRELDVELPMLQGDLEYIALDPANPTRAIQQANEMINSLIAALRGIYVSTTVVEDDPAQSSLRYQIGLDYNSLKQSSLFLWQYKVYCQNDTGYGGLHNLALAYSNCELPIHSVRNYLQAYRSGEVLSANNVAHLFLKAGMADDAKAIIDEALKNHPESGSLVGRCLADIRDKEDEENKAEERLLAETAESREFLTAFGEGLVDGQMSVLDGMWAFRFGNIELRMTLDLIEGNADIKDPKGILGLGLALGGLNLPEVPDTYSRYTFRGIVTGRTCKFSIEEKPISATEHRPLETLLGASSPKKKHGYIVFQSNKQSASVMEVDGNNWGTPYAIKRISPPASV